MGGCAACEKHDSRYPEPLIQIGTDYEISYFDIHIIDTHKL
jgi:hypothetical protein